MTFGECLRQVRERRGMSQQELADRAHVSRQLIYFLESGRRESTSVEIAKRIALALGVSIDYLAGTWDERRAAVACAGGGYETTAGWPHACEAAATVILTEQKDAVRR